jgi:hypothetical protein
MACCALAAFVVSQLLFGLDWLRERVLGAQPVRVAANPNAAWRLGDAPPLVATRAALAPPRRLALALGGGALAFALAAVAMGAFETHRPHALRIPYLCTSSSVAALD